jgi:hypothetical protein
MKNSEIIQLVEEIVTPYFQFSMEYPYGDRGSCTYPDIEKISMLVFKKNGKDRNLVLSKDEEKILVDQIKNLNVGELDIIRVHAIGKYITITLTA